ncbi:MAG TPA: glycosyltransferase [Acidimicrobiales bacterium]|jgi:cellulose synthase/poly-beta-1,6-N-acetylglucosamine synthase-like glycosyltransferase|nr:glycosyltransferase [Acidimicrobiales bacterium]
MLVAVALLVVSLCLFAVAMATLWWMLHAWRTPEVFRSLGFGMDVAGRAESPLSFSLIVPARHEEAVLGATLDQLAELDYSAFEVLAVVGHDDPGTRQVADAAARRHAGRVRVVVDHSWPKNKPTALNTALADCRGDVVGVFDAEDEVHPRLLRQVAGAFDRSGAHVVQGGVQLVNFQSSWYALRNCLEYFFWFRSRLHLHAERRFIPLGGNTVFVRTDLLVAVGGWDPECLAEDCELGVRLSSLGARIDVAYDPMLVTREETPGTLRGLLKQRTRWNQGFLQVLRKGEWRRLPTLGQRALARYTLAMPFLQAFTGLVIPFSIYSIIALKIPVALALVSFLPVIPTLAALAFELVGLREFGRVFYAKPRAYDYVRLVLGLFPYQLFLAGAAVRAVVREVLGLRGWEKTAHTGVHRPATAAAARARQPEPEHVLPQSVEPEPVFTMAAERR